MHKQGQITISRIKLYKRHATPGAAWNYAYTVQFLDGIGVNSSNRGTGLAAAMSYAKTKAKELNAPIVLAWKL